MVKIAKQHRHEVIPAEQTLKYIDRGLRRMLLTRGQDARTGQSFVGGFDRHTPFRPTQKEAAQALVDRISDPKIPLNDRRIGFYDHATGLGKTAEFAAVLQSAYSEAEKDGKAEELVSFIVVPTTNLLHQTKAEVEDYAPILKRPGMIGVYGDGKKELGKPVTIITYNSWIDLVESGQINPAKINIHIADEAHKNTSDRREEVTRALHTGNGNGLDHPDADSPQAFCLAVTATSRYDDEKTVERTYKHKLHEKSMMAGVESGELCEYIRPQEYLIRVDSGTKEDGWKKFVIDHFATGKDLESGQPLHKMVAAFYVNGTAFADDVAKDLNAHPDLAKLAKERGMLGVAVSIHSNMSPKEQERRLRDYMGYIDEKTGQKVPPKYMAVVGDEKFKAGWNHPPLKCIFDYTRGSLVDKSQIAGRGGRRYLDPKTGEPTGLVLIDTILYFGAPSEDKFNEGNRDRALANAVTFIQLLEGRSAVYRAGRKPREEEIELDDDIERAPRSGGRHIPGIGKVESFVSLSQVRNFNRQTAAAIAASQRDVVSDEEHRQLLELMAQKDMGAKALFELIPSERAKTADLTVNKIAICKRGTKLERPAWEVVVDILRQQPNAITDKEHQQLLELAEKKGLRAYLIFKLLPPKEAEALNIKQSKINACIHRGIRLKRSAWELVMQLLQQQPDQPKKERVSDQEHQQLLELAMKKGLGPQATFILIPRKQARAVSLTEAKMAGCWREGTKLIRLHWELVMDVLRQQSDPLPDKEHQQFVELANKKGLKGRAIFKLILPKQAKVVNLTEHHIGGSLNKGTKLTRPQWELVMDALRKQSDPITDEEHQQFLDLMKQKGLGGHALFSLIPSQESKKLNLKGHNIEASKKLNTKLERPVWELVMRTLCEQPDPLTDKEHQQLMELMRKKGLGGGSIFELIPQKQANAVGLNASKISSWQYGIKPIRSHWDIVMNVLREQPDPITDEEHQQLVELAHRKGLGGRAILELIPQKQAKATDLTGPKIAGCWQYGIKLTRPCWELVMDALRTQPDPLTDKEHQQFLDLMKQKGLGAISLIKIIPPLKVKGVNLTVPKLENCKHGNTKLSRPAWEVVMATLRAQPDKHATNDNHPSDGKGHHKNISAAAAQHVHANSRAR